MGNLYSTPSTQFVVLPTSQAKLTLLGYCINRMITAPKLGSSWPTDLRTVRLSF